MKSTKYLYDIDPEIIRDMPYETALEFRIYCCKALLKKLVEVHYTTRDDIRINHVMDAEKFNQKLLNELNGTQIEDILFI